eukprot:5570215-Amphidinium_carterae.1
MAQSKLLGIASLVDCVYRCDDALRDWGWLEPTAATTQHVRARNAMKSGKSIAKTPGPGTDPHTPKFPKSLKK